jgi:DNA-binding MurR/RpiR family transcriptional regulator
MSAPAATPATADELRAAILARYEGLSKRLQQVARHVLDEPDDLALETLAVIAERSGVQPSAIVRFAKTFGFEGASQMQRLFRDGLLAGRRAPAYGERVRRFSRTVEAQAARGELLDEFIEGASAALANLRQTAPRADLEAAIALLRRADTVYVVGFRRSFPVASYLAYSLQQAGKRTVFIDGVAGLARQQVQTLTPKDLLLAVSYQPYSEETVEAVTTAAALGAKVLSLSDSLVSPIAKPATVTLQVRESEIRGFRSLSASMCLAQALVIGFAFAANTPGKGRRRRAEA